MIPTGMVLIGSSVVSGLMAIFLFALIHNLSQKKHDMSFLHDLSKERLHHLVSTVKHIRVMRHSARIPILNYHTKHQKKISHIEVHHKDGSISRIHPNGFYEKEILVNKIRVLESKLSYHGLPNIISYE